MSKSVLMPKATAIWLVQNTSLTFKQIANFCEIHELEVQGIADEEVLSNIPGFDPIASNQLTRDEIKRCEAGPSLELRKARNSSDDIKIKVRKSKYVPIAKRQDKPDAIYWLLKTHPDITEKQVIKLIGTTKSMIQSIKDRTHWNMKNIKARDPVMLGLCSQRELTELDESKNDKTNMDHEINDSIH